MSPVHQSSSAQSASDPAHPRMTGGPVSHVNSGDSSANLFAQGDQGLWAYIQQLEDKSKGQNENSEAKLNDLNQRLARAYGQIGDLTSEVGGLRSEIGSLRDELINLRKELELARSRPSADGAAPL